MASLGLLESEGFGFSCPLGESVGRWPGHWAAAWAPAGKEPGLPGASRQHEAGLGSWARKRPCAHFQHLRKKDIVYIFFWKGGGRGIDWAESLPREHTLLPAAPSRASTDRPAGLQQEGACGTPGSFASSPASGVGKHGYPHQFLLCQKRTGCVLNQLSTSSSEANTGFFIASWSQISVWVVNVLRSAICFLFNLFVTALVRYLCFFITFIIYMRHKPKTFSALASKAAQRAVSLAQKWSLEAWQLSSLSLCQPLNGQDFLQA